MYSCMLLKMQQFDERETLTIHFENYEKWRTTTNLVAK